MAGKEKKLSKSEARKAKKADKEAKRKQPTTAVDVTGAKRPVLGPPVVVDQDATMVFRLSRMDEGGPYSWAGMTADHVKIITTACRSWEQLRVTEFIGLPGTKPIPVHKLCAAARKRLTEVELDDLDELWELRPQGKERIWGVLDGNVFYVLWWDPEHQVCPAPKKHT
jgi:hypothetical protein